MHKLIFPIKDSTIYSRHPERNTGVDQILELTKICSGSAVDDLVGQYEFWENTYNSRILIDFDLSDISASISSNNVRNPEFYLTLKATEAVHIPLAYTLYAHPISASWVNGTGYYNNNAEVTNGVSWLYRDGTLAGHAWSTAGGDYYSGSGFVSSQSFNYQKPDVHMNVTTTVRKWLSGSISQYGFLLKHSSSLENDDTVLGSIKFFSNDTHTIYVPRLEAYWDSHENSGTSSINEVSLDNSTIYIKNLRDSYQEGEIAKLRIGCREKYPTIMYVTSSNYTITKRVPATTYYQIKDEVTEEILVPYHMDGTKVSCDSEGNYILIDMNTFLPERFYRITFKLVNSNSTEVRFIDQNFIFKVIR
jgi:hypothetical protein